MKTALKIIIILTGIFISGSGIMFTFNVESAMEHAQLSANTAFGIGTIRGLIGGTMLIAGLSAIASIVLKRYFGLHAALLICAGWSFGRIVSLFIDGFDQGTLIGLAQSLVMVGIFVTGIKVLEQQAK